MKLSVFLSTSKEGETAFVEMVIHVLGEDIMKTKYQKKMK